MVALNNELLLFFSNLPMHKYAPACAFTNTVPAFTLTIGTSLILLNSFLVKDTCVAYFILVLKPKLFGICFCQ